MNKELDKALREFRDRHGDIMLEAIKKAYKEINREHEVAHKAKYEEFKANLFK